ncbi:unnamed protein product [Phytophthora lilii]|uniref:Unnamed protein product n=1 Tax=Phytophthora lilii TaxID=2077276 RepID=A0A9W6UCE9_9STRA|nr:unnamed protein product [Phytophthora lilii]
MSSVWEEAYDEASGRAYYFNRLTGDTSWTLPGEATSEAGALSTENVWQQSFDEASQTTYYYNIYTGETSWTLPENVGDEAIDLSYLTFAVVCLQSMFRGSKDRKRARRLLKAQYQFTTDPETGKTLYTHLSTNTSSWSKPALFRPLRIPDDGGGEDHEENDDDGDDDDDDFEGFQQDAARDAEEEEIAATLAENTGEEVELDEAAKRKLRRKYPRSRAQLLVDAAEDAGEDAKVLNMSGLDAWKLSSRIWNLQFLKTLVLSHNCLTRIPSGIQDLIHLEELDVSHNQLTRLPSCLQTTTTLTAIRASHNSIQAFSPKLWKLREIRYLDLSHNRLKELPYVEGDLKLLRETREWQVGVGLLTGLEVLLLNDNRLVEVPKSIEKCSELTLLDLSNNQLSTLSDEIPALSSLHKMVLHHNGLRTLPEAIGDLFNLHELDLAHNRLITLPESVGALHNLKTLKLFSNQLRLLPKEFGALRQLCHLDLDNNSKLINLENFFRHLPNISFFSASSCGIVTFETHDFLKDSPVQTIRLGQNALMEFPLLIGHAAMQDTLQELVLAGNHLTQVPLAVLLYCSHLQHLDISNNSLRALPTEIAHLRRLELLYLCTNALQELPDELTQLPRLRELKCDHNQLERLPLRIGNLTQLTKLNVSFNRLRSLPTSLMELTQLVSLHASDNLLSTPPPAIFQVKCFCEFSNNPFSLEQYQHEQDRRGRLALASKLIDAGDFSRAEQLLSQLLDEVETLSYVEQNDETPQLHFKRGLCRFMLQKRARQQIDEVSAVISTCEQEMHGAELIHARQLRLKAKQKRERPEPPEHHLEKNEDQPEDPVKQSYAQAVSTRSEARATHQTFAAGALIDLKAAIESEYVDLPTAYHLKGLVHMALHQYPDAVANLTKALKGIHAPLPDLEEADNQKEAVAEDAPGHIPPIPEASIQLFLCRAEAYRGLGQLPSAIADLRHVVSRYPIQHDSTAVAALEREYLKAWENEQAAYSVDDAALLRAFNIKSSSGLARRPEVLDIHAEALAAATAKKKAGSHKPPMTVKRLPPAERFRLACEAESKILEDQRRQARAPFDEMSARSRAFLARARDFKREVRANLQMEMEETQQRHIERETAREAERRRLEQQREVDERMIMKYEDEWMHWFVSEELRLENERQRRADEAQRRADAKVAYAARLAKRGGKRQAAVGQRGKGNSRRS